MDDLQVRADSGGDCMTTAGAGIIDRANHRGFRDRLLEASETAEELVVDLREADFMDSAMVEALTEAALAMGRTGTRLKMVASESGYPIRVVRISGLQEIIATGTSGGGKC